MMPFVAQPISPEQLREAQADLDAADLAHWRVSAIRGSGGDSWLFKAESVAGGRREVCHYHQESLVALAQEVEARNPSKPVAVAADEASTTSYR
jgi:hypothetical protein